MVVHQLQELSERDIPNCPDMSPCIAELLRGQYKTVNSCNIADCNAGRRGVPVAGGRVQRAAAGPRGDVGHDGEDDQGIQQEGEVETVIRLEKYTRILKCFHICK